MSRDPWPPETLHPRSHTKMMGCGEAELESVGGEEALAAPGLPPEPRAPEPRAPVPEPGLDLSLSSRSETPERPTSCPGRRKGRAERRGGARKGRQVSWGKAWPPGRTQARATYSRSRSLLPGPLSLGAALPRAVRTAAGRRST